MNDRAGVLLVDKPVGPTSHDVVSFARRKLGIKQVGHCGTLDPLASGLLIVCVGAATRLAQYLSVVDKTYQACIELGRATSTADREGSVVEQHDVPHEALARVHDVLAGLRGEIHIAPPSYSAAKVGGVRAYQRARAGQAVEPPVRSMTVHAVEAVTLHEHLDHPQVSCMFTVSKGTYIRSLALEVGRRLGVPAHLFALRRTACGVLGIDDPRTISLDASRVAGRTARPLWWLEPTEQLSLVDNLADPVQALPFGVISLERGSESARFAWQRLTNGQAIALPELALGVGLAGTANEGTQPIGIQCEGVVVIARVIEGRVRPERLVRIGR